MIPVRLGGGGGSGQPNTYPTQGRTISQTRWAGWETYNRVIDKAYGR